MAQKTFPIDGCFQTYPPKYLFWQNIILAAIVFLVSIFILISLYTYPDGETAMYVGVTLFVCLFNSPFMLMAYSAYRNRNNTFTVDARGVEIVERGKSVLNVAWKDVSSIERNITLEAIPEAVVGDMKLYFFMNDDTVVETSIRPFAKKGSMKNALRFYFEQSRPQ